MQCILKERNRGKISEPLLPGYVGMFTLWSFFRIFPDPLIFFNRSLLLWDRLKAAAAVAFFVVPKVSQGEIMVRRGEDGTKPFSR